MFVSFVTGLWMTKDGGKVWALVDSNFPNQIYKDLDVAISNPKIVYAASGDQVIKSIGGGLNRLATKLKVGVYGAGAVYDIAVSTSDSNIVVVRTATKIYRTTDGGDTWEVVTENLLNNRYGPSSITSFPLRT